MRVVFLEEVEGTARTGDVKNVADGFARNFLLPRKLAAPATDHYITIAQAKATKEERRQSKLDEDAQRLVPQVEGKEITIEVRVGEQDKMFGSVTARDIAELLQEQTKIDIEHRQIDLKQPIRELGSHAVNVKLTRNVLAGITVHVQPIGGAPDNAEEPMIEGVTESGEPSATPTETHAQEPVEGTREDGDTGTEGAHAEEPAEGAAAPVDESASEAELVEDEVPADDSDAAETADVDAAERTSEEGE
jgi:large subunit ribosomal protein L9